MKKGKLIQKDKSSTFDTCYGMYFDKFKEDEEMKGNIPLTEEEFVDILIEVAMDNYDSFTKETRIKNNKGDALYT